jgi:hypothetical protein
MLPGARHLRLKCKGDAVVAGNRVIMVSRMMTSEEGSASTISTLGPAFTAPGLGPDSSCRTRISRSNRLAVLALRPQPLFLLPKLGRERFAKVSGLIQRADFDFSLPVVGIRALLEPLDRLLQRIHLP